MQKTEKTAKAGVALRPFFVSGVPVHPGDYYDGPEAGYLVAVGKCRKFDPATERVVESDRHGAAVKTVELRPATKVTDHAEESVAPDDSWTNATIRAWIEQADPGVRIPANASKTVMLEAVQDILRQG